MVCFKRSAHRTGERNMDYIAREDALALLKRYNQDPFHLQHAFTVEAVMKWYANELGYAEDAEYWGIVGLLHDIDFEQYPEEHCLKAPEILREGGVGEDIIHSVVSHGYGITIGCGVTLDVAPEHEMEKVLFAADELTGLIWAAALMRPSKSTKDMELKSLKKKYNAPVVTPAFVHMLLSDAFVNPFSINSALAHFNRCFLVPLLFCFFNAIIYSHLFNLHNIVMLNNTVMLQ